jgi:DNA-binding LytR/AlgR family response regulator
MVDSILIVEDEQPNVDRLSRLVNSIYPGVTISHVDSVSESVLWFKTNNQPDIVLMDIRLSDGLCFEIFDQVKIDCPIIFTTAYDEYALNAFKVNGIDYLLKPIELEELQKAFKKVEHLNIKYQQISIDHLLKLIKPSEYRSRFLISYRDGFKSIMVGDISYFYSEFKATKAMLLNGKVESLPQSLEELEQQLNPKLFFRVNRQFIVHIDSIKNLHNHFNGKLKIELKINSGVEVIVSRSKAALLKEWLNF